MTTTKKVLKKIAEIFTDDNGKLSSKRTAFPFAFTTATILTILQGTGYFENEVISIINNLYFLSFGLIASSLAEKFAKKR